MFLEAVLIVFAPILSAIVNGQPCTLGTPDLQQSSINPTPGIFIQQQDRAPCSGVITQWTVCYYNPATITDRKSFQILLEVWRNEPTSRFNNMGGNSASITIPDQPADFQCLNITVDADDRIDVNEGDFLGVYLPSGSNLPVVTTNSGITGSRVFFAPVSATPPTTVVIFGNGQPRATLLFNHGIHVTATIESADATAATSADITTSPPPSSTSPPSTTLPSTTQTTNLFLTTEQEGGAVTGMTTAMPVTSTVSSESSGSSQASPSTSLSEPSSAVTIDGDVAVLGSTGLSPGGVAAIVIVLVLTIAVVVTVGIMVLALLVKKRKQENKYKGDPIDNAVYGTPDLEGNVDSSYHNMSMVTSYEVPINTLARYNRSHPIPSQSEQPGTLERGFVDSFTSENDSQGEEGEEVMSSRNYTPVTSMRTESACSSFNPYATLAPVELIGYYNTFLNQQQNHDQSEYSVPNVEGTGRVELPYREPSNNEEEIYRDLSKRTLTISRKDIHINKKIGEGAFSTVSKATWKHDSSEYDVAVKELIQHSTCEEDKIRLLQEAAIMGQFHHPNIVKLFGVVKHGSSPMLVTEFLHKGDLLAALNGIAPDPGQLVESIVPEILLNYSQQVALGMHYLASKGFVHRDLAARNIFVTKDDICKVGDFGLSRELANTDYYVSRGGVVPVRWTAPEAIFYRKYSSASDVWSYGCLLYEIWTMGMRPYEGIATNKYLETLQAGYRLPPPPGCPRVVYSIMIDCWNPTTNDRPTFSHMLTTLLKSRNATLYIPPADSASHPQAALLCASLEAGLEMYKDLQNTYVKASAAQDSQSSSARSSAHIRYSGRIESQYETEINGDSFGEEDGLGKMGSQNHLLDDSPQRVPVGVAKEENLYDSVEHGNAMYYDSKM